MVPLCTAILGIVATGSCLLYCLNNSKFWCWITRKVALSSQPPKRHHKDVDVTQWVRCYHWCQSLEIHCKQAHSTMTLTVESTFVCMLHVWNCSTSYPTIYPVAENLRFYSCTKDNSVAIPSEYVLAREWTDLWTTLNFLKHLVFFCQSYCINRLLEGLSAASENFPTLVRHLFA